MTTGRNPGRRDNIAPRETILIAKLKNKSKCIEHFVRAPRARELTSSIIVVCVVFCNTIVVDNLHGHMLI